MQNDNAEKPVEIITLAGFGDFSGDDGGEEREQDIREAAERLGLEFYPTYYDHELKGDADAIEKLTKELWSMGRDEWPDNGLTEQAAVETCTDCGGALITEEDKREGHHVLD